MRKQFGHIEKLVAISMQGKPIPKQQHFFFLIWYSGFFVANIYKENNKRKPDN